MERESLDALHRARPFRPFVIHMGDGRSVRVTHPELLARGGRTLVVFEQPGNRMRIVDLMLVTELEINGGARARSRRRPT
jgi:hypothetical protein